MERKSGLPAGDGGPVTPNDPNSPFADSPVEAGEPPPPTDRNADGMQNENIKPPPPDGSDKVTQ
jgi:hypothetical protein